MIELNAAGKMDKEIAATLNAEGFVAARGYAFKRENVWLLRTRSASHRQIQLHQRQSRPMARWNLLCSKGGGRPGRHTTNCLRLSRTRLAREPAASAPPRSRRQPPHRRLIGCPAWPASSRQRCGSFKSWRIGIELLERLALEARNQRGDQPLRLAHFDNGDDRAICSRAVRDRLASDCDMGRCSWTAEGCHTLAARPISSETRSLTSTTPIRVVSYMAPSWAGSGR